MSKATTFEFGGRTIGVFVEENGTLQFFATIATFSGLEGLTFRSLHQLDKAARAAAATHLPTKRSRAVERWRGLSAPERRTASTEIRWSHA
jgi:hypothetical protein